MRRSIADGEQHGLHRSPQPACRWYGEAGKQHREQQEGCELGEQIFYDTIRRGLENVRILMVRGIGPGRENMQIDDMFMRMAVVVLRMVQMKMRGQDGQHEQRDNQHPADLLEVTTHDAMTAHPASVAD